MWIQATVEGEHEKIVGVLLDHGAQVDVAGGKVGNALQAAAWDGHEKVTEMLPKKDAIFNALDPQGHMVIHLARKGDRLIMLVYLLHLEWALT